MSVNGFIRFYQAEREKFSLIFCAGLRKNLNYLRIGYKIERFDNNQAKEVLQMETKFCLDVTKICDRILFFTLFREFEMLPAPVV